MDTIAYGLRAEYADQGFTGGLLAIDGDRDFNVLEELEAGGGTIAVQATDTLLVNRLDAYPALKRVSASDVGPDDVVAQYDAHSVDALRTEVDRRGITGGGSARKADLIAALEADDARVAAGIATPTDNSVTALAGGQED